MTDLPEYVLDRRFNAPASMVWRTWTDPDLVPRWYGPGVTSIVHKLDPVVGGEWLHEMRWDSGGNFQRSEYIEVEEPSRLVFLQSVTDAEWNVTSNPMMPDWPRTLLTTVTFVENAGATDMRLIWSPHDATEAEIACFKGAMAGLSKGWGAGMELLEALLAELQT